MWLLWRLLSYNLITRISLDLGSVDIFSEKNRGNNSDKSPVRISAISFCHPQLFHIVQEGKKGVAVLRKTWTKRFGWINGQADSLNFTKVLYFALQVIIFYYFVEKWLWRSYGTKYSRMDQVNLVEDSLLKIWTDMACFNRSYPFKFFKGWLPQILLGPFLNTLSHINLF